MNLLAQDGEQTDCFYETRLQWGTVPEAVQCIFGLAP